MIMCINKSIKELDDKLNDELWLNGTSERSIVLKKRLKRLIQDRDNGIKYEVNF